MYAVMLAAMSLIPGQACPPGSPSCPNVLLAPSPLVETPPAGRWWLHAGNAGWVRGWTDRSGTIRYYPHENIESIADRERLAAVAQGHHQAPTPSPQPDSSDPTRGEMLPTPSVPVVGQALPPIVKNYGIDLMRTFTGVRERYHATGPKGEKFIREAKAEAKGVVGAGLDDDSNKPTVTVMATDDAARKDVADKIKAAVGDRAKLWSVSPDHWSVRDVGLSVGTKSAVVVQRPDGVVTARLALDAKPEDVMTAVRKADPAYSPANDPGAGLASIFTAANAPYLVGLGILLLLVFSKPKEATQ